MTFNTSQKSDRSSNLALHLTIRSRGLGFHGTSLRQLRLAYELARRAIQPVKPGRLVILAIAVSVLVCGVWWYRQITNPYSADGLRVEWVFGGATSTVPGLDVWVDYNGTRITPDFLFGGINNPSLRYRDFNGDGRRDIVFGDNRIKQVVSFNPATSTSPPTFTTLRNDVTWP